MLRTVSNNIPIGYFPALVREKRSQRIQLLCSKTIQEAVKQKASKIGCSLNEYIIQLITKDLEQELCK